ncbi:MAG: NFACT RNA binding domain-containing protein [Candidatus Cloacimonetes bacterium]|nr:NFACT RNA binding domain-containing protein [Candidatus Cloacimonadota bacterium]
MDYAYLASWVAAQQHCFEKQWIVQRLSRFENQYRIEFRKRKTYLQIDLANSSCFFSANKDLPFKESGLPGAFPDRLTAATLRSISLAENDRIITLHFTRVNMYSVTEETGLVIELAPRFENLILTVAESGVVIDCLKRISLADNKQRQVLPGAPYQPPETTYVPQRRIFTPPYTLSDGTETDDINRWMEANYYEDYLSRRAEKLISHKTGQLNKKVKKANRKLLRQREELADADKEKMYRQKGELLKANFHLLKRGMKKIFVTDYFTPDAKGIKIDLDPKLGAQQNIEQYFKKYRKSKSGKKKIIEQIKHTEAEIEKYKQQIFDLEDTEQFSELLTSQNKKEKKQSKEKKPSYKKLRIDDRWELFIGRTSTENDQLTTRFAKPDDWWFHCRMFHGSHIILRNYGKATRPPENLILLATRLAAYYSKAKNSKNVPVDFTSIRYVRKPRGSAPGYVIYKNQKTYFVDPLSIREAAKMVNQHETG